MLDMACEWDFFLAHASPDEKIAEELYDFLVPYSKVFLASRCLQLGVDWDHALADSQKKSLITVVFVSPNTSKAYYQREEIATAIAMTGDDDEKHRVIPIYLDNQSLDQTKIPYGLRLKHGLSFRKVGSYREIARELQNSLSKFKKRTSWEDYEWLFSIGQYKIAYIPLTNDFNEKPKLFKMSNVSIQQEYPPYELPEIFFETPLFSDYHNKPSCRLASYYVKDNSLLLKFSETSYEAYLKSNEHLDDPLPGNSTKTFRDEFGRLVREGKKNLRPFELSNICGTGTFIISKDDKIIVTKHSQASHVYPGRFTFSASGTMKWGAYPHPFTEVMYKCFQEIGHQVNPKNLRLIGFGADARKLFFQFSFFEKAEDTGIDIVKRCTTGVEIEAVEFEAESIVELLMNECWEPAAEASLLTLFLQEKESEYHEIVNAITSDQLAFRRKQMRDEWDYRASRPGDLPNMSVRYAPNRLDVESKKFVNSFMQFLRKGLDQSEEVVEFGSGTGRFTNQLVDRVRSVTCVDLCERMNLLNKNRLGKKAKKVKYVNKFAQDYKPPKRHDILVSSLVLIHNVHEDDFRSLVRSMCECSDRIFICEDITENRATSPHTLLLTEEKFEKAFGEYNFVIEDKKPYRLFEDNLIFLNFVRKQN